MASKNLEIIDLKKKYNSNFDLHIEYLFSEENRILAIIGPNGAGKSTLIRLINLLEKPDYGSIHLDGVNILGSSINQADIRKKMAVVFQEPLLFNTSVYDNILIGLKIRKIKLSDARDRFYHLVQKLKIGDLLYRSTKYLSGGEKQRVSLARALVLDPKLLLLDEPLVNIDQRSRENLRTDLFEVLKDFRKSVIYVTHDRNEAMILADDIAVINNGRIEQFGSKDKIFRKPRNEFVAKFVGVETLIDGIVLGSKNDVCEIGVGESNVGLKMFVVGKAPEGLRVILTIRPEDVVLYNIDGLRKIFIEPENEGKRKGLREVMRKNDLLKDSLTGVSSAMNLFTGEITEIKNIGILKKVEIDCGFNLISFVTQNSVDRLGLKCGKIIAAGIKASSIHLFKK